MVTRKAVATATLTPPELRELLSNFKAVKEQVKQNEQAALALIAEKSRQATELINEAAEIADLAGVEFQFSIGDGYGMSAYRVDGSWQTSSYSC